MLRLLFLLLLLVFISFRQISAVHIGVNRALSNRVPAGGFWFARAKLSGDHAGALRTVPHFDVGLPAKGDLY